MSKTFHPARCLLAAAVAVCAGCVSVKNDNGFTPPSALCSRIRATVALPKPGVRSGNAAFRIGRTDGTVHLKEWVFSGISADVVDMTLSEAVRKGRLKTVHYVDYEQTSYLGFVTVFNIVAYGE